MFIRTRNKSITSAVQTDKISHVTTEVYTGQPGTSYFILFSTSEGSVKWPYDTEEKMNQEFEWIMSKLDCVQNVPETVIDQTHLNYHSG